MTGAEREALVVEVAVAILARRGFGFYACPMEGGQDAYDISCEAIEEARAALAVAEPVVRADEREACITASRHAWPKAHTYASENADMYRAQDHAVERVLSAISARGDA